MHVVIIHGRGSKSLFTKAVVPGQFPVTGNPEIELGIMSLEHCFLWGKR